MQQIIAIALVPIVALIVMSLTVTNIWKWWPSNHKWIKVMATVIAVDQGQDWKYDDDLWERDQWSGDWRKRRTWESYYAVTAQWVSPQTRYLHVFSDRCWVNETTAPAIGAVIPVIMHPRDPNRYEMIFKR